MRPILVYAPGGPVPDGIRQPLVEAGADVLVASTIAEAAARLSGDLPDIVLVIPPARASDVAPLLARLEALPSPPPVFVISADAGPVRPVALEVVPERSWTRATKALKGEDGDAASALLLTRVQLVTLLELWEERQEKAADLFDHTLRTLALALDAGRVSLFRWRTGEPTATVAASSAGGNAVGTEVEIVRYPELRAAAARSGPVLVEEIARDPLMDEASRFLSGVPVRSLLCQRLPGIRDDLYLHAVRETVPFGPSDVALVRAATRLLTDAPNRRGALEKSSERRRLRTVEHLFAGVPEPTALVSSTGEILLANPPFLALTGRLESELVGLPFRSLLRPARPEDEFGTPSPSSGSSVTAERARLSTASGDLVPVEILSLPAGDDTHREAGWSALTVRDRREEDARQAREVALQHDLKETSEQLEATTRVHREADAARARFWNAAAHELRTPLAIAQSHLEVVLSDLGGEVPERPAALLKTAAESLHRLERLIADVLDAAVAGRARATVRTGDVDLAEVLTGLYGELAAGAARRGLELVLDIPETLPRVSGDKEKIQRLLTNLVDHSLRSAPKKVPAVVVSARNEEGRTRVCIVDHGPAVSTEKAAHLFDDVGTGRSGGDFGLSVARRLADAMGLELNAWSGGDGSNIKCLAWPAPPES